MKKGIKILIATGCLFALGVGMQFVQSENRYYFALPAPLKDYLPKEVAGWTVSDEVLGDTEFMRSQIETVLRYSDILYRVYRKGDMEVGVYVCYWKPGRQDEIDAGSHNPDNCWVQSGWEPLVQDHGYQPPLPGGPFKPGQYRFFSHETTRTHVMFWHLIGGQISGYAVGQKKDWGSRIGHRFTTLVENRFGFYRYEQCLVRISSNVPFERLAQEPGFVEVFNTLVPLGIKEDAPSR